MLVLGLGPQLFSCGRLVVVDSPQTEVRAYENDVGKGRGGWKSRLGVFVVDRCSDPGVVDFIPAPGMHLSQNRTESIKTRQSGRGKRAAILCVFDHGDSAVRVEADVLQKVPGAGL